jgi:transaldolase
VAAGGGLFQLSSPASSDVFYINVFAAPFTVHTIPDKTVLAFADHGSVGELMAADGGDAKEVLAKIAKAGIDYEMLGTDLQQESAESFGKDWNKMLASIESKRAACKAAA